MSRTISQTQIKHNDNNMLHKAKLKAPQNRCKFSKKSIALTVATWGTCAIFLSNMGKEGCRYAIKSEKIHYRLDSGHYSTYVQTSILGLNSFQPLWGYSSDAFSAENKVGSCFEYPQDYKELKNDYFQKKAMKTRFASTALGCVAIFFSLLSLCIRTYRFTFPFIGVLSLVIGGMDAQALDFIESSMCNGVWSLGLTTDEIPTNQATPPDSSCTSFYWGAWLNIVSVSLWFAAAIICLFSVFCIREETLGFHRHLNCDDVNCVKSNDDVTHINEKSVADEDVDVESLSDEEELNDEELEHLPIKSIGTEETICIEVGNDDDSIVSAKLDESSNTINNEELNIPANIGDIEVPDQTNHTFEYDEESYESNYIDNYVETDSYNDDENTDDPKIT